LTRESKTAGLRSVPAVGDGSKETNQIVVTFHLQEAHSIQKFVMRWLLSFSFLVPPFYYGTIPVF
jgi:hypothetical protein